MRLSERAMREAPSGPKQSRFVLSSVQEAQASQFVALGGRFDIHGIRVAGVGLRLPSLLDLFAEDDTHVVE